MSLVLTFSGKIASGKSTLSRSIARELHWPWVSFGDYVRTIARERHIDPTSVPKLQELGDHLVNEHLEEFCAGVLSQQTSWSPGRPLVIDGLRHVEVLHKLASLVAPSELVKVYIAVGQNTRLRRLNRRAHGHELHDRWTLDVLDRHPIESEVRTVLPALADIVVNGESDEASLVQEVRRRISRLTLEPLHIPT